MTDDIIRKATTADYIETIDNLRAEVKRLRSQSVEQVFRRKNEQIASKDARIKELEAILAEAENFRKNSVKHFDLIANQRDEALVEIERLKGGTQMDNKSGVGIRCKCGELVLIDTTEQDQYLKRLEAAFLGATKEIVYAIHEGRDAPEGEDVYAEKVARDALEKIKAGGTDESI